VVADRETAWPDVDEPPWADEPPHGDEALAIETLDIETIVSQLAPIRSREALAASFAREANPDDLVVRAAYARVWADLALVVSRRTTRRARIRAMTGAVCGRRR
jgi:hypothetical protein